MEDDAQSKIWNILKFKNNLQMNLYLSHSKKYYEGSNLKRLSLKYVFHN